MLIDAHCHLEDWIVKDQVEDVLAEAQANDVQGFVLGGTRPKDWHLYSDLAKKYSAVRFCVGLHPSEIKDNFEEQLSALNPYLKQAIAIGEIGLDFSQLPENKAEKIACCRRQIVVFEKQLRLAKEYSLPIVIHCREAMDTTIAVLDYVDFDFSRILFHCFSGNVNEAKNLFLRGAYLSYSGILTFKSAASMRESFLATPTKRFLVETDCPFLAPVPYRGKTNRPALLRHTAEFAANLRGMPLEDFKNCTVDNTQRFFGSVW